ncbi:hypothetical protein YC2023_118850 [Brassica napus]
MVSIVEVGSRGMPNKEGSIRPIHLHCLRFSVVTNNTKKVVNAEETMSLFISPTNCFPAISVGT